MTEDEIEKDRDWLLELLLDVTVQACQVTSGGYLDSCAISAYASALRELAVRGRVEILEAAGRRVIARVIER